MAEAADERGLEYILVTDHGYERTDLLGRLAVRNF